MSWWRPRVLAAVTDPLVAPDRPAGLASRAGRPRCRSCGTSSTVPAGVRRAHLRTIFRKLGIGSRHRLKTHDDLAVPESVGRD